MKVWSTPTDKIAIRLTHEERYRLFAALVNVSKVSVSLGAMLSASVLKETLKKDFSLLNNGRATMKFTEAEVLAMCLMLPDSFGDLKQAIKQEIL